MAAQEQADSAALRNLGADADRACLLDPS
jgi:hypothetical protein